MEGVEKPEGIIDEICRSMSEFEDKLDLSHQCVLVTRDIYNLMIEEVDFKLTTYGTPNTGITKIRGVPIYESECVQHDGWVICRNSCKKRVELWLEGLSSGFQFSGIEVKLFNRSVI